MKNADYVKKALATAAAAAAITLSSKPAEAQFYPGAGPRIVPGIAGPVMFDGWPVDWRPYAGGVYVGAGVRTRTFGFDFVFINGARMPFFRGLPGYFDGPYWFPGWLGPRPIFRDEIAARQWYNLQRSGLNIGEARALRRSFGVPYGSAYGGGMDPFGRDLVQSNVEADGDVYQINAGRDVIINNGDRDEDLRRFVRDEPSRRHEPYRHEQARPPVQHEPQHEPQHEQTRPTVQHEPRHERIHTFSYAEDKRICPPQYIAAAADFLNDTFEAFSEAGGEELRAYVGQNRGSQYLSVWSLDKREELQRLDFSDLGDRELNGGEFVRYLRDATTIPLNVDRSMPVRYLDRAGQCGQTR